MLYLWDFPKIYTKKKTWYKNFEFIPFLYHGPEKTCVFMRRNGKLIKKQKSNKPSKINGLR